MNNNRHSEQDSYTFWKIWATNTFFSPFKVIIWYVSGLKILESAWNKQLKISLAQSQCLLHPNSTPHYSPRINGNTSCQQWYNYYPPVLTHRVYHKLRCTSEGKNPAFFSLSNTDAVWKQELVDSDEWLLLLPCVPLDFLIFTTGSRLILLLHLFKRVWLI